MFDELQFERGTEALMKLFSYQQPKLSLISEIASSVCTYLVSKLQVPFQLHDTSATNCVLQIKFCSSCISSET